jgi:transketolase
MGSIASEAVAAAAMLEQQGISCGVVIVASIAPPPIADLVALLSNVPLSVTIEAHYINGGIGSLVSEVIAENNLRCHLVRYGISTISHGVSGSQAYLHDLYGLTPAAIVETTLQAMQKVSL